jgi:hypothetical protein
MHIPRKPTQEEINDLIEEVLLEENPTYPKVTKAARRDAVRAVAKACIAVFDDYEAAWPGMYDPKFMMVIWGLPNNYQLFCWDGGILTYVPVVNGFSTLAQIHDLIRRREVAFAEKIKKWRDQ